ncbi:MAG: SPOR domain-containing protein [Balneolaceae bacterium]|nr:SPOR domain-containing protein [Balneolaceae bacterium]
MKNIVVYLLTATVIIFTATACGPSQEEQERREKARQDSLEQVRQQQMEQQRMDSIAAAKKQARADSIAAAKKAEEEKASIKFDPNGSIAVQVEAWRSRAKAQAQVSKWQERGFTDAYVVKHGNADTGNIWFRVRLGRVASMDMAEKLGKQLQNEYDEPYWVGEVQGEGETPSQTD